MCGIVGTVGVTRGSVSDPIAAGLAALVQRGPDGGGRGTCTLGGHPVVLAARRLALVDPAGGHQPLTRPSGAMLVWNGEIYNHESLRRWLVGEGVPFHSESDAEVLAALLEHAGVDGLARVEGSYAFAFLVAGHGALLLGRDPAGPRPLAYARLPDGLAFASTLDALRATGVVPVEPDLDAIVDVLRDGVVPSPRTALKGVERVPPGTVLRFDGHLGVTELQIPQPERAQAREAPHIPDVLQALRAAVRDRLAVDRPAALLLSGGIDSALIAAVVAELGPRPAFTLSFPEVPRVDETDRARRTAKQLGLEHVVVPCPADPSPWVLGAARAFDEPFADASAVPTWGLARAVGRVARVALSGTGGDEVFGGYRRYWLLGAGPWLRQVPRFLRESVSQVIERRMPGGSRLLDAVGDPEGLYRGLLRLQPVREVKQVLGPLLERVADPVPRPGPENAWEAMAEDLMRYLPDDLLVKEDRAFMAHSVEGRYPYLDGRVRRAARDLEIKGGPGRGRQKHVLRAYVRDVVDPDLARVSKRGFSFPVDDLYRSSLRGLAEDCLLARQPRERGFISPAAARRLLRDHLHGVRQVGQTLHALVMLELWARRVLDGE